MQDFTTYNSHLQGGNEKDLIQVESPCKIIRPVQEVSLLFAGSARSDAGLLCLLFLKGRLPALSREVEVLEIPTSASQAALLSE